MPKYILIPKQVMNLGGYIVENQADLGYRDVLVGNPFSEAVKIYVPIYGEDDVVAIERLGILVHRLQEYESLVEELKCLEEQVNERRI